ncbi:MAG TPA: PP2C family protein-serine/threonine phosphatase [Streptosporangiaceae bacterium]|nr:PP2C family protein-serine/threonine phosphatase [Streptosporangiaceae bacterium]
MPGRGLAAGHDLRVTGVEPVTRSSMQRLLDVLPFLIMGAVAGAALAFGPRSGLLELLALGPAFAAVSGGLRKTIAAGVVALVLNALLAADQVISTWGDYARDSAVVVGVTIAAVIACTVRQRREQELVEVRAIAEVAQQVLLGPVPDAARSVRLAVRYMSATSHARIGGDLYEVVTGPTGMRLIIGDVQGKGLVAVKTAATVLGSFREVAPEAASLAMIADRIEIALARQLDDEQFVTAVLAEVSLDGSWIKLLSCGHPPPLLITGHVGRFVEPTTPSLPLGLAGLGVVPREVITVPFAPDDQMLFYTDGVSEARNRAGEFYPLPDRAVYAEATDPDSALNRLQEDVLMHVGHALDDDAAMLLVRRRAA